MKTAILNVTGYAGSELARLLHNHPEIELTSITGRSAQGQKLGEVFPHLSDIDLVIEAEPNGEEMVFSALPHKSSGERVVPLVEDRSRVVDLSADFRLRSPAEYEEWYKTPHASAALQEEAVYGLTELYRSEIGTARLVANPGCFPTSAILALAPLVKEKLVQPVIIIDSKSGVSGAGRGLSLNTHFSEVNENVKAYGIDGHRHLPEIVQEVSLLDSSLDAQITFLPHLIPMTRGILSSCYATLSGSSISVDRKGREQLTGLYREFYAGEPFVRVVDTPPQTKQTWGNNYCLIYPTLDLRTGRVMVVSCIDNLVKGAAGQAIQNMNVMAGYPEEMGLESLALFP